MIRGAGGERGGRGGNRGRRGAGLSRADASFRSYMNESNVGFDYTSDGAAQFAGSDDREASARGRGQGNRNARGRRANTRERPDVLPNIEHDTPQEAHGNARQGRFTTPDRAPLTFHTGFSFSGRNDHSAAGSGPGQAARGGAAGRARGRGAVPARGAHAWGDATPRRNWYAQPMVFSPNLDDARSSAVVAKVQRSSPENGNRNSGRGGAARRGDGRAGAVSTRRYAAQQVEEANESVVPDAPISPEGGPSAPREGAAREPTITSPPPAEPISRRRANAARAWSGARQDLASPTSAADRGDETQKEVGHAADGDAPPDVNRGATRRGQDVDDTYALGEQGAANDHAVNSVSAAGAHASPSDSAAVTTEQAGAGAKDQNEEDQEHSLSAYQMDDSHVLDDLGPHEKSTESGNAASNTSEEPAHDHVDAREQADVVPDLLRPMASNSNASARLPLRGRVSGQVGTRTHFLHNHAQGRCGPFFKLTASSYRRQRAVDDHQNVVANERAAKKGYKREQAEGLETHRELNVHPPFANVFVENCCRFLMVLVVTVAVVFIFMWLLERNQRPR